MNCRGLVFKKTGIFKVNSLDDYAHVCSMSYDINQ